MVRQAERPVRRELPGDASPAAVLARLAGEPHLVALTGSWAGTQAIIGARPLAVRDSAADLAEVLTGSTGASAAEGVSFGGGWIGYLGYGLARTLQPLPPAAGGPRLLPSLWFGYYDHVLVRRDGRWYFEALAGPDRADYLGARYAELAALMSAPEPPGPGYHCGEFTVSPSPAEHRHAVARAVELIKAGDLFQANVTLRLEAEFGGDPLGLFGQGLDRLDAAFGAFVRLGQDRAIASFSPELFLRRAGREVRSSPVKGTSPRSADPAAAARQRAGLTASAKNLAENVMIVDLMRSDLSAVCEPGTVTVPRLAAAEPHPGLWHLVSDVRGVLAAGQDDPSLIAATFPPGSVTGAPKVRAMEVIAALECAPREVYTGAIGYRSPVAGLELSVAIRTFEFGAGRVWLGAGGGIVADSDPAGEYAECLAKSRPLIEAVAPASWRASPEASADAGRRALAPRPAAGIFTSLPVGRAGPVGLTEHLDRLAASARAVYGKELPAGLTGLVDAAVAGLGDQGDGQGDDGQGDDGQGDDGRHRLRITVRPLGGPLHADVELVAETAAPDDPVWLRPVVVSGWRGGHKWADRRLLASLREGLPGPGRGAAQALLVDEAGYVLETDGANVCAVRRGVLRTPPADGRILPGIMRGRALAAAAAAGLRVSTQPLSLADLTAADEIFVTNSVIGVRPAVLSGGRAARSGPVTGLLASAVVAAAGRRDARPRRTAAAAPAGPAWPESPAPWVLVIDNYDSFTYNLVHLLRSAGTQVEVVRNDEVTAAQAAAAGAAAVLLSPGPCAPADAGVCVDLVRALDGSTPVLGVCLGHQAIAVAYGGQVRQVPPVHGKASRIEHDGHGLFAGLPADFSAARYHSLLVQPESLPAALEVSACAGGLPMAIRHRHHPVDGVQFHPESILTGHGPLLIGNFLRQARTVA